MGPRRLFRSNYIYIYIYLHVRIEDEEEEDGEGRSRRDRESVGWKGVEGREGRGRRPKGNTCQEGSCHDDLSRVSREVAAALHHRRKLPLPSPTPPNPYTRPPLSLLPRENPNKLGFLKASRAKTSEEHLVEEPSPPPPPRFRAVEGGRKEARKGGREGRTEREAHGVPTACFAPGEEEDTRLGNREIYKRTGGGEVGRWRNMDFFRGPPSFSRTLFETRRKVRGGSRSKVDDNEEMGTRRKEETDRWNNRCVRAENRSNRGKRTGLFALAAPRFVRFREARQRVGLESREGGGRGKRGGLARGRARVDGQIRSLSAV